MDVYCRKCGEPWELDSIHEEVSERTYAGETATYATVGADFRARGCSAIGGRCSAPSTDTDRHYGLTVQEASSAFYDLLGDDMDGAASMLEDMVVLMATATERTAGIADE